MAIILPIGSSLNNATYYGERTHVPYAITITAAAARTGNGTGDYYGLVGRDSVGVIVSGTFSATITFMVSMDGINWVNLAPAITAASTTLTTYTNLYVPYIDYSVAYTSGSALISLYIFKS